VFEAFAMNEERVLALAGLYQACALAQQLATQGRCDEAALEASLASVFRIDAPSVVAVYGGIAELRPGLRALVSQLDENGGDMAVTRMAMTVMRLERSLSGRRDLLDQLQQGILAAQRQVEERRVRREDAGPQRQPAAPGERAVGVAARRGSRGEERLVPDTAPGGGLGGRAGHSGGVISSKSGISSRSSSRSRFTSLASIWRARSRVSLK
jgi:hypothetical protein